MIIWAGLLGCAAFRDASASEQVEFSIDRQHADDALTTFAQQAGLSVLFPYDAVSGVKANRLEGVYSVEDGLAILLADTGLEGTIYDGNRLTIRVSDDLDDTRARNRDGFFTGVLASIATALGRGKDRSGFRQEFRRSGRTPVLEEVKVTGSRIRRNDFNSAQPAIVLSGLMLQRLAIVNAGDAMVELPSNLGSWTPTAKPGGNESYPLNVFNGLNLANLRGLNPTYGSRTLTLLNSRRQVPTNQGDGVDLNMIPTILIDRMEVVTGGASASYGSGAIGGVVNLLLDRDLEGAKIQLDYGATAQGDGSDRHFGLAWGGSVGQDSHFLFGIESQEMDPIEHCIEVRDWCAQGASIRNNIDYATNSEPNFVYRENVRRNMSERGVLAGLGLEFDESGTTLVPFEGSDSFGVGGDGQHIYLDTTLRTNVDRRVAYASYDHELGPDLGFSIDVSLGNVKSWTPQDGIDLYAAELAPDNFYLNALAMNPCASTPDSCSISKDFSAQIDSINDTQTELRRVALGFGGRFGDSTWTWDAYYQRGRSEMTQAVYNSRHALRLAFALDAVDDGAGNPICRVTRDGVDPGFVGNPQLADGCVPLNIFGTANITSDAYEYSWGQILEIARVEQDVVEFVSSGDLADGFGGGAIRAAAGMLWRSESLDNIADMTQPDYIRNDYNSQFGETFGGDVEVLEYFAELDIPVTYRFDLQAAARSSHFENTAGVGTQVIGRQFNYRNDAWKASASFRPVSLVMLRGSRSKDLRAPNFRELYYSKVFPLGSNFGYCDNPWTGNRFVDWNTFTGDPCRAELRGGLDLTPEKSDTTTFGIVLSPPGLSARVAIDYFQIEIDDAITPGTWFYTIDRCYEARDPEFCSLIEGRLLDPADPLGGFARIDAASSKALNQAAYDLRGIDLSAEWARDFGFGTLSMRFMASHMIEQLVQPDATSPELQDISGVTGSPGEGADWEPAPDWTGQWLTSFDRGPLSVGLQARYVSAGRKHETRIGPDDPRYDPNAANSIDNNHVPSYLVWALGTSYDLDFRGTRLEVFASIENALDKDPPLIGSGVGGTNPVLFDTVGRRYRVGVRAGF